MLHHFTCNLTDQHAKRHVQTKPTKTQQTERAVIQNELSALGDCDPIEWNASMSIDKSLMADEAAYQGIIPTQSMLVNDYNDRLLERPVRTLTSDMVGLGSHVHLDIG